MTWTMTDVTSTGRTRRTQNASIPPEEPSQSIDPRAVRAEAGQRHDAFIATAPAPAMITKAAAPRRRLASLTKDVLARRDDVTQGGGSASVRALADARTAWCTEAGRSGLKPPPGSFDPARASDAELGAAVLWTEIGGALPLHSFADGGTSYRDDLRLASQARSPFELRVAPNDPELRAACHRELARVGADTAPRPEETVASLADRIALARQSAAEKSRGETPRTFIGASGRVGSEEAVAAADFEAYLSAMAPGTTTGVIFASFHAGDLDGMRKAGELGNALEDIASPFARGKRTDHPLVGRAADNHRP